jgi:hypothetical protein
MSNGDGHLVAEGLHQDAFNAMLWEICFKRSLIYWTREFVSTYETVRKNILIIEGDFGGNAIIFLSNIERHDTMKVYASVWELDKNHNVILANDDKVEAIQLNHFCLDADWISLIQCGNAKTYMCQHCERNE